MHDFMEKMHKILDCGQVGHLVGAAIINNVSYYLFLKVYNFAFVRKMVLAFANIGKTYLSCKFLYTFY